MAKRLLTSRLVSCFFLITLGLVAWQPVLAELKLSESKLTVFDTERKLQWVRDASLAGQPMTWQEARDWAANLDYDGHSDWRLPSGEDLDGNVCDSNAVPPGSADTGCAATDLGHLYHNEGILPGLSQIAPFQNVEPAYYWTSSEAPDDSADAMAYDMGVPGAGGNGAQNTHPKTASIEAWAVRGRSSDFETSWPKLRWPLILFLAALGIFAIYWTRRKQAP